MLIKRRRRTVPGLNTTSTADISFMLLTFFLVTTSMDVDKGLMRQLPPIDNSKQTETADIDKSKLIDFRITADSRVLLDGQPVKTDGLRTKIASLIRRRGSHHLISVSASPEANYDTYFNLENEIVAAYNVLRNEMAKKKYGREYERCTAAQRSAVRDACPLRIAEDFGANADTEKGGIQ